MQLHPEIFEKQSTSLEEIRCDILFRAMKSAVEILEIQEAASIIKAPRPAETFTSTYVNEAERVDAGFIDDAQRRANDARAMVSTSFMEPASFASHLVNSQENKDAA